MGRENTNDVVNRKHELINRSFATQVLVDRVMSGNGSLGGAQRHSPMVDNISQ